MKKFFIILFITTFFFISSVSALEIKSNNAVLYNLNDNTILIDKNKDEKASIASLTKLMTALVAIDKINNLDETVTFIKSDYDKLEQLDASISSMKKDQTYTYKDLLYGLIMESGADCANAIARLTYNTNEEFVKAMNQKAKDLKLKNTHFANPIGLDDKENYSTVEDVATILKKCLENNTLKNMITAKECKLSDGTVIRHTIDWYAKKLEIDLSYIKGGKTGFETNSGYALASIAEKDNVNLLLVTTNGKEKYSHIEDAKSIYDYYFNNYSYKTLVQTGQEILKLKTKGLSKKEINIYAQEDVKEYLHNDFDIKKVKLEYDGINTVTTKNKYMQKLGTLKIYYEDKLVKEEDIILNQKIYPDFKLIAVAALSYSLILSITARVIYNIKKRHYIK